MRHARSDVMSVAVPLEAGGCGVSHSRPVTNGVPDEVWTLTCPACEVFLAKDPLWSATEAEIPETPDEVKIREDNEKRGQKALERSQKELSGRLVEVVEQLASAQTPAHAAEPDPGLIARLVEAQVAKILAEQAHPQPSVKIIPATVEPEPEPVEMDLHKLHWKTLQKMCRERGLPDDGSSKDEFIRRLKVTA